MTTHHSKGRFFLLLLLNAYIVGPCYLILCGCEYYELCPNFFLFSQVTWRSKWKLRVKLSQMSIEWMLLVKDYFFLLKIVAWIEFLPSFFAILRTFFMCIFARDFFAGFVISLNPSYEKFQKHVPIFEIFFYKFNKYN